VSLTDIMSSAGLSVYTELALILFVLAFVVIVWRVFSPSMKETWKRAARMPLDDDASLTPPRQGE
jgi:cbb3-type cytochrome oxidase subunit 3